MYIQKRPRRNDRESANSPAGWAANFAGSGRMNWWRAKRLWGSYEARLVRRFIPPGSRVLDAGCGFGEWVTLLREHGYAAEGLDNSPQLVERLRKEYPDSVWHYGDVRKMDLPPRSFDAIISWGVIEHDEKGPVAALREFASVLREGGTIIVTVPRDNERNRRASRFFFPEGTADTEFFQFMMAESELAAYVAESGFEVLEAGSVRRPSLALARPSLYKRGGRLVWGAAARLFALVMGWSSRWDHMIYCCGRKKTTA
jgi:SAM-dependent methyltransferase